MFGGGGRFSGLCSSWFGIDAHEYAKGDGPERLPDSLGCVIYQT